jgi:hypothetical protein
MEHLQSKWFEATRKPGDPVLMASKGQAGSVKAWGRGFWPSHPPSSGPEPPTGHPACHQTYSEGGRPSQKALFRLESHRFLINRPAGPCGGYMVGFNPPLEPAAAVTKGPPVTKRPVLGLYKAGPPAYNVTQRMGVPSRTVHKEFQLWLQ